MTLTDKQWAIIKQLATKHGVKTEAFYKWRQTGKVPGGYQITMVLESRGRIRAADFRRFKE